MKILTVASSDTFDPDGCPTEFVLLDLSSPKVVKELRRWRLWAETIQNMVDGDTISWVRRFYRIVVRDYGITAFFNDHERRVVKPYLVNPDAKFKMRPFLGDTDVCVVDDTVMPPDTAEGDHTLCGDDGTAENVYSGELCASPYGFYARHIFKDAGMILESQEVPWSILEEYEKKLMAESAESV